MGILVPAKSAMMLLSPNLTRAGASIDLHEDCLDWRLDESVLSSKAWWRKQHHLHQVPCMEYQWNPLDLFGMATALQPSEANTKKYKSGQTLVGLKFLSIYSPIVFYQYLVMNYVHTDNNQIRHAREQDQNPPIRYFVPAVNLCLEVWSTANGV